MKRLLMVLMIASVFMATSAQAANGKVYFSVNAGLTLTDDMDVPGLNLSFDPGYNVGGAVGYDFGKFRAEGEITYRSSDLDTANGAAVTVDSDVSALSFMANGYYDHEMGNSPLTPYVGFGMGVVDSDLNVTGTSVGSETNFAYQFMLGLGYGITPNVVMTGGYRYFGVADSVVPNSHEFVFGARYMF